METKYFLIFACVCFSASIILYLFPAEAMEITIPPTPAFSNIKVNGTWHNATLYNDSLEIETAGGGSGENNTASNVGFGEGIFKQKTGIDLEFLGIACGGDIQCSSNTTDITLSYTGTPMGSSALDDLTDVIITSPAYLSTLFYNGVEWIDKIFSIDSITCGAGQFVNIINNQTGATSCGTPSGSGNATVLTDLGDVIITSPAVNHILQNNGTQFVNKLFMLNNQTSSIGVFISGLNNQTGVITTQTLKVNTFDIDCTDSQQINRLQYDNTTGIYTGTCETDETGSGTAREDLVAIWDIDRTLTNIGTAFVNVYNTGLGDPLRIDTNGMSTATLIIDWTKVGAGTQSCVIRSNTNPAIELITFANIVSGLNTNATFDIPTNAENLIDTFKPMCKSTTAGDDPVFLSAQVLLKP